MANRSPGWAPRLAPGESAHSRQGNVTRRLVVRAGILLIVVYLAAVAFIASMFACGPSPEEKTARSADSIVALAAEKGLVFRGVVSGNPVAIMVRDCKVYNLDDKPRSDGVRPVILRPDFYPWPTACGPRWAGFWAESGIGTPHTGWRHAATSACRPPAAQT